MNVTVTTTPATNINDQETNWDIKPKTINYNNKTDRQWLAKHSLWALTNGYSVTTIPIK